MELFNKTINIIANQAISIKREVYELFKNQKEKEEIMNNIFEYQLNEYNNQKFIIEKENSLYKEKIIELKKLLNNNLENNEGKKYENKINLFEKEKENNQNKLHEIDEEIEDIAECKKEIKNNPINENIFGALNKYSQLEIEKWVNSLNLSEQENKIQLLKKNLLKLFDNLFDYERVNEKMNNLFINTIKTNIIQKALEKMNFIVVGYGGVGKTTLIHEILCEKVKSEIIGNKMLYEKYESKFVPFLQFFEIMREDININNTISDIIGEIVEERENQLDKNVPNEYIHSIIYCLTRNRIYPEELIKLLKLREKYGINKLPIIIVYTNAVNDEEVESYKLSINKILNEHNESLNNDKTGISFIKLNAREKK